MNKYITRILAVIMAVAMVASMTACGGNSDAPGSTAAPTAAPTTGAVNVCETEGHAWVDANCEAPKTCSVCGETDGEALGHSWIDATYQAPKTCETCGATEGEALVSYFAETGLDAKLLDKSGEYDIEMLCPDEVTTTTAKVIVTDYQTIASDEAHEALDGYEWKILSFTVHFYDENAQAQGFIPQMYMWYDKYTDGAIGEGINNDVNEDLFDAGIARTFNWNGIDYADGRLHIAESITDWLQDDTGAYYRDITVIVSVRVPVGYDGFVFALEKSSFEAPAGSYLHEVITDNTLMFCMD